MQMLNGHKYKYGTIEMVKEKKQTSTSHYAIACYATCSLEFFVNVHANGYIKFGGYVGKVTRRQQHILYINIFSYDGWKQIG